ncbi:host-nuclease inhibitor Gam family protein [Paenibacillus larvae]|uniref:Mu-like prophage host-nuclease inhibitor protein Gam n=1 Tax=Paenibacillus larvae subsp. larvae TaxID=147375 RepID=A0A6C0QZC2_9BACL|nr:host-nuclease inhibitor Gam family protein [Paenibacillus larvae]QHZ54049.1 Mu-like prophage host-nuclease inhibitor protein Gam [Paenibacillus larvae subsp. larvae]
MLNAIHEYDIENVNEMTEEEKERFRVTDTQSLNWVLRKMKALEIKKKDVNETAQSEIEYVKQWEKKEIESIDRHLEFFQSMIGEYAVKMREEDPEFKVKTPHGTVKFAKKQSKWYYKEDILVSYLKANQLEQFIRVKEEPNKVEIKKTFNVKNGKVYDPDGQQVEGINVEQLPDELSIKLEI